MEAEVADGVKVVGRAGLLRRAVENVVRNAVRFAPPGTATVTVRDHGPGVPDDAIDRILAPFFRVGDDRRRDEAGGGVGLGLAIARRAVAVHGGRITARNARPGLEVRIELPVDGPG